LIIFHFSFLRAGRQGHVVSTTTR